jgi:hypothetical protein
MEQNNIKTLQLLYAGLLADSVAIFEKYGILEKIKLQKSIENKLAAPARVNQFGLKHPEDVFNLFNDLLGFTKWKIKRASQGCIFSTEVCKLKSISSTINSAKPCDLCCIDPLTALCESLADPYKLEVYQTMWEDIECIFYLHQNFENQNKSKTI